jgi:hypothetical protein
MPLTRDYIHAEEERLRAIERNTPLLKSVSR